MILKNSNNSYIHFEKMLNIDVLKVHILFQMYEILLILNIEIQKVMLQNEISMLVFRQVMAAVNEIYFTVNI